MSKIFTVTLPDIGEGVVEGEVIEWLKQPGDSLQQDEPVVIVMTDKATVELPAPYPGKLRTQYCQPGGIACKDKPLYDIELTTDDGIQPIPERQKQEPHPQISKAVAVTTQASEVAPMLEQISLHRPPSSHALAAPPTRKLATQLGVDIDCISGSGKEGRVMANDVIQYHATLGTREIHAEESYPTLHLPDDEEIPLMGIRNLMAKKMVESHRTIPHFSYFEQVDATRLVQLRQTFKTEAAKQGIAVTYMPFIIKALSLSLRIYPTINSSFDAEKNMLLVHKQHHVGIAITTKNGLIVPVLRNVQAMSLQEVIQAYDALKKRALAGKLQTSDRKDSTITISNFGVLEGGGLWATPIINYPEVAILAIAKISKQPIVKNQAIVIRDMLNLSWSFDHRIVDGELAASFSHHMSTLIQNPAPLL